LEELDDVAGGIDADDLFAALLVDISFLNSTPWSPGSAT
jgi:hypothetical protein